MTAFSRTRATAYLKERWEKDDQILHQLMVNSPILGMMYKDKQAGGRYHHIPILKSGPQGRSAVHATARTNAVGSNTDGFDVTYGSNYQIAKVDGNLVDDTKISENAIYEAIDHEMKAAIANMKKDLRLNVFGNLGGSRGVIGSVSTTDVTLAYPSQAIHFEVDMEICVSAADGTSGALRDSGQAVTLAAVDFSNGILTADENWSEISGTTAGDYLFAEGDFGAKWSGLAGWIPVTAPTSGDDFFGVDRSSNPTRFAGWRYTATGEAIESAFINACAQGHLFDATATIGVVNPVQWGVIANSLGADSQNRRIRVKDSSGYIGYDAVMVYTQMGDVPIVSDPGCPVEYGWVLDMSTWKVLCVGGDLVRIIDDDGLLIRRAASGDEWEIEIKARGNFACTDPSKNGILSFV